MGHSFLFILESNVPLTEAEMSLHLAMFAVEGLAGRARVRMDASYRIDEGGHAILVGAGNRVGRMIARVFAGLLHREFGEEAFHIERVDQSSARSVNRRQGEEAVA